MDWCTIESDPGVCRDRSLSLMRLIIFLLLSFLKVFTELISSFGVKNVQVDEIYSLDQLIENSYGLIFLFKWKKENDPREPIAPEYLPDLFFAQQVSS